MCMGHCWRWVCHNLEEEGVWSCHLLLGGGWEIILDVALAAALGSRGALERVTSYADGEDPAADTGADAYSKLMLLQLVRLLNPGGKLLTMITGVL